MMGFRDSFINGYLLAPVGPRQRTFAQWSLEDTLDTGLRANQKQVQALRESLVTTFQAGISRLEQSQMQSARLLQRELQYQADNIIDAVDRGSADVVGAVQKACDYLGGQLCEVRWAIERHSQISQQILQILLNALDNTSRQYWEQGVKCYETSEYEIARERFNRALDANRTNYFAYQYLGFIAAHEENSSEALKNFELARKFADSGYHRALALSHLARSYYAIGDNSRALQSAIAASESAPDYAKFWYECAICEVRCSNTNEAIQCLRRAICSDWTYWSISISDANLDAIRQGVDRLLEQMREEQRAIVRRRLDHFAAAIKTLRGMQITTEIAEWQKRLDQCETSYQLGTVFAYRDLVQPALDGEKGMLAAATKVLDERIAVNRSAAKKAEGDQAAEVAQASARIYEVESKASRLEGAHVPGGCVSVIGILGFIYFFISYLVMSAASNPAAVYWGHIFIVACLLFLGLALTKPIMKFLKVSAPAANMRAEIPRLKTECDEAKARSEDRLSQARLRLNGEFVRLKNWKDEVLAALVGE